MPFQPLHLASPGVSLVLDPESLRVLHWGSALSTESAEALPRTTTGSSLLPLHAQGHLGRPALAGHRRGRHWSPSFRAAPLHTAGPSGDPAADPSATVVRAQDAHSELSWAAEFQLLPGGLLRVRHTVRNEGAESYALDALTPVLPVPARATESMDLTGRWAKERQPLRHPLTDGARVRESRRGRPGHDAAFLLSAGTAGFGFDEGEVWSVHLAWSGNQVSYAERSPSTETYLGGGESFLPGELELPPGQQYTSPWLYAAYSPAGLNGTMAAFHDWLRSRPRHPAPERSPRPVMLNTWEAAYFEHQHETLHALARRAAEVGVERFVLDDGWFRGRRDDTAGLGDWEVDEAVWPEGLGPLIDQVRHLGMDFGLWVEPEMLNTDSELHRAHPEWVLHAADRLPPPERHQYVLDLSHPGAYAHVRDQLSALLETYPIGYLKWDHNRDLLEPGHSGRAAAHAQTRAANRLIDELRCAHPDVEVESCASGGARVDLDILERTDRVWASDCNDPLERHDIQRYTALLLPPELIGAHIGPPRSHSTGRQHDLAFRATTALFGNLGVEWDLTRATTEERTELAEWIALYKRHRTLLHTGRLRHVPHPDPAARITAVLATDRSAALIRYAQLATTDAERPAPLRLGGLDPEATYRVDAVGPRTFIESNGPLRREVPLRHGPLRLPGALIGEVGLTLPRIDPETAVLLHLTRLKGN